MVNHVSHAMFHTLSHKICSRNRSPFGWTDETFISTWTAWTQVRKNRPRLGVKGFYNSSKFPLSSGLKLLNQITLSSRQAGDHSPDETSMSQHCSSIPQSCLTFAFRHVARRCLFPFTGSMYHSLPVAQRVSCNPSDWQAAQCVIQYRTMASRG